MTATQTIVVPLDGSDFARRAVPVGAGIAARLDAELVVMTTPLTCRPDAAMRPVWLDEVATSVEGVVVRTDYVDEHPASAAICTALRRAPGSVACMATHGRGTLGTAILGSVAR